MQTSLKRMVALKMIIAGAHAGPQDLVDFALKPKPCQAPQPQHRTSLRGQ